MVARNVTGDLNSESTISSRDLSNVSCQICYSLGESFMRLSVNGGDPSTRTLSGLTARSHLFMFCVTL